LSLSNVPDESSSKDEKILFRVHNPKLTQVVTGQNFHYFKLRLLHIDEHFQTKKTWNHDYPAAQQIYSDTPSAIALRSAIATEHKILYSGRGTRDGNVEGVLERKPQDFFDLLAKFADTASVYSPIHSAFKNGFEFLTHGSTTVAKMPGDDLAIYTYSLMDKGINFSRSGASFSVDTSSKHAVHAGGEEAVFYAGEFWLEDDKTNEWGKTLYMDNNSGTFAPPKCDLGRLKALMEDNFPRIPIVVLDYQDDVWKVKRKGKKDAGGNIEMGFITV